MLMHIEHKYAHFSQCGILLIRVCTLGRLGDPLKQNNNHTTDLGTLERQKFYPIVFILCSATFYVLDETMYIFQSYNFRN